MIENDRQMWVTLGQIERLQDAARKTAIEGPAPDVNILLHKAEINALYSVIRELRQEMDDYEPEIVHVQYSAAVWETALCGSRLIDKNTWKNGAPGPVNCPHCARIYATLNNLKIKNKGTEFHE